MAKGERGAAGHASILREAGPGALSSRQDGHLRLRGRGIHWFAPSERLCSRGDDVIGFDNFDPFYPRADKEKNLTKLRGEPKFTFVEGDIRDAEALERVFAERHPEVVVHLAALAGVRPSLAEPARFADVNVTGTQRVFDASRAHGVARFVFGSSSSVYGRDSQPPFKESDPCLTPVSPYAATKRANELMLFAAHHLYAVDVTCLRFFTVFGPRQRPDLAIHKFARLMAAAKPIPMFGDGSTSRDYTYVDDIIDGVVAAIDQPRSGAPGFRVYNLGGSRTTTLKQSDRPGRQVDRNEAGDRGAARAAGRHAADARRRDAVCEGAGLRPEGVDGGGHAPLRRVVARARVARRRHRRVKLRRP